MNKITLQEAKSKDIAVLCFDFLANVETLKSYNHMHQSFAGLTQRTDGNRCVDSVPSLKPQKTFVWS